MCYNLPAQIHSLGARVERITMSDIDSQILELFRQLASEQRQEVTCLVRAMSSVQQEENLSDQELTH